MDKTNLESGDPRPTARDVQRRAKLCGCCESLPEARVEPYGQRHLALSVRGKAFAYYLFHHHDDGRVAICAKAPPGRQQELIARDAKRYYVPAYLGKNGWVSLRLDQTRVAWDEVLNLLVNAYRLTAPKRLVAQLD